MVIIFNTMRVAHLKGVWPKPKRGPLGTFKVPNGALGCRTFFRVWVRFDSLFRVF